MDAHSRRMARPKCHVGITVVTACDEKDVVAAMRFASHGTARARTSHIIHTEPQGDPIFYASTRILAARGDICALSTTDTNADGGD